MKQFDKQNLESLTGLEKISILLLSMEESNAKAILEHFTDIEIHNISKTISSLGLVNNIIMEKVINQFISDKESYEACIGNIEITESLLKNSIGEAKANIIVKKIQGPKGNDAWEKLSNLDKSMLYTYLKDEHPQVIAFIMTKIKSSSAAELMSLLSDEQTIDVIVRMTSIHNIDDSIVKDIEARITQDLNSDKITAVSQNNYVIADILNNLDREAEAKYMSILKENIPERAEKIKELMFTFDDVATLSTKTMLKIISNVDNNILIIALKGADNAVKSKFFDNMSVRAVKLIQDDMEALGSVKLTEIDKAQIQIANIIKALDQEGVISLKEDQE